MGKKLTSGAQEITPVGITTSTLTQLLKKECQTRKIKVDTRSHLAACVGDPDSALLCRFTGGRTNELYLQKKKKSGDRGGDIAKYIFDISRYEVVVAADGSHSKIRDEYFKAKEYL